MALLALFFAVPAHAQSFPAFSGYVVDAANILPPDVEASLATRLQALDTATHRQLVVATIPDLQGYPIEDYGYKLGRAWGVGQKATNNGAILIVAPNDRKVRVEVGYGLEPVLTDAFSSLVVNGQILPRFKAGDMPGGIVAGTNALADQLALPDVEAKQKADAAFAAQQKAQHRGGGGAAGLIFWLVVIAFVALPMLGRRRGGRSFGGGILPIILWDALSSGSRGGGWGGGGGFGGDGGGGGFGGGGGGSFGGGGASGGW